MASSPVEICNIMLSLLGSNSIISFDDQTVEANFCKVNYDPSRRAVLESREWTFSVARAQLVPLAVTPLFGYSFEYLMPPSCLRVIGVYDPNQNGNTNPPMIKHQVEGKRILANIANIDVKYVFNVEDTQQFSPNFDQALAAFMGYNAAIPLTQDMAQQDRLFALYERKISEATAADSLQGTRELLEVSQLEQSRRLFIRPS